jgi:hypothetical protein
MGITASLQNCRHALGVVMPKLRAGWGRYQTDYRAARVGLEGGCNAAASFLL